MNRISRKQAQNLRLFACGFAAILVILAASALSANATSYNANKKEEEAVEIIAPDKVSHDAINVIENARTGEDDDYDVREDAEFESSLSLKNAVLLKGGALKLTNAKLDKTGDAPDVNADYYGTNAALLTINDAKLLLSGGKITSDGAYANALFAYGNSKITTQKTTILTNGANAGGIMVAAGGQISAEDIEVATSGEKSPAIRTGFGGGSIKVTGGQYKTTGANSPVIYSVGEVSAKNARLEAITAEGIIIDGDASVDLNYVTLTDNNSATNTGARFSRNIVLQKSDDEISQKGTTKFTATGSTITTSKGWAIYATNTSAKIELTGNSFVNDESNNNGFLRIEASSPNNSANATISMTSGADVDMTISKQNTTGAIEVDRFSTLNLTFKDKSKYQGAINKANNAKRVTVSLSADSIIVLNEDTHIDRLDNEDSTNQNIYSNKHKLYVGGEVVSVNDSEVVPTVTVDPSKTGAGKEPSEEPEEKPKQQVNLAALVALIGVAFFFIIVILIVMAVNKSKQAKAAQAAAAQEQARLNLEAQMRAQEQSQDFGKNNYPYPPYA